MKASWVAIPVTLELYLVDRRRAQPPGVARSVRASCLTAGHAWAADEWSGVCWSRDGAALGTERIDGSEEATEDTRGGSHSRSGRGESQDDNDDQMGRCWWSVVVVVAEQFQARTCPLGCCIRHLTLILWYCVDMTRVLPHILAWL